jgi:2-methyl-1,2-propanediol dehydrogenase
MAAPPGSMSKFSLSVWPKALKAGATLRPYARVLRLKRGATDAQPAPSISIAIPMRRRSSGQNRLCRGNGVGTPRLLLASDNLSNSSDQVGRNLLHHTLVALEMWVDEAIKNHMGCVASLISRQFAETALARGFINGFQLNCLTGAVAAGEAASGWVSDTKTPWGRGHRAWFEKHFGHMIGVYAIGDDLPNPNNRIILDRRTQTKADFRPPSCSMRPARTTDA